VRVDRLSRADVAIVTAIRCGAPSADLVTVAKEAMKACPDLISIAAVLARLHRLVLKGYVIEAGGRPVGPANVSERRYALTPEGVRLLTLSIGLAPERLAREPLNADDLWRCYARRLASELRG